MHAYGMNLASRLRGIGIGLSGSLFILAAAGVVLAVVTLSNMLTFGPSQVGLAVTLTKEKDLPSPIAIGQESEIRFRIEASQQVTDATLWLQLRADGVALDDPASVRLTYRHPGTGSFSSVTLTSVGGVLKAPLRSGWSFPEDYDDTGNLRITFQSGAPAAAYSIDLWAEGTVAAAVTSPTPTPTATPTGQTGQVQSFTFHAFKDGFVGGSGANSDGSLIASVINPTLQIKAGEPVQITVRHGDTLHNLAIFPAPCPNGFCDNAITGGRSSNVTAASPEASITFSYPTAGATLYFYCEYHPEAMNGTIAVTAAG